MLFHTWTFAAFFLIFYPVFFALKNTRGRLPWLLAASYVFYGFAEPLYVLLLFYATSIDYLAVVGMSRSQRRRPWLVLSVVNNLVLLSFFKYGAFVADNLNDLATRLGVPYAMPVPGTWLADVLDRLFAQCGVSYVVPDFGAVLPVGISFFVFQSMSYTIDYYRGNVRREPSFIRYATFVSLFPQLVAGPIERAKNLLPQIACRPAISRQDVADGFSLFVVGLFKKVALADCLAQFVDPIYNGLGPSTAAPALILATVAFAWQIYFDFSGYTDMARGIGRMLGLRLMLNFNHPYLATGLGDFWRRWHISLSTWFRDYVYIPLGGNRRGAVLTYVAMCLTMIVSGLWHGPLWKFVVWGTLHAAGRAATRTMEASATYRDRVPTLVKRTWTFAFVSFAWIFFRANNLDDAWLIVGRIARFTWADPRCPLLLAALVLCVWLYQFICESKFRNLLALPPVRVGLVVAMLLYVAMTGGTDDKAFIYFQF
ncbi:MAG: MBOAT family protein [Candidatus Nealsonbacteria bacterium]|nr:MBOAT family protein [Candidatus Nealsonbacteria bacterium]